MPTIVTENGRISVPKSDNIIVKVCGWVKYRKDGKIAHIPPHEILRIEENDPNMQDGIGSDSESYPDSSVVYQKPYSNTHTRDERV